MNVLYLRLCLKKYCLINKKSFSIMEKKIILKKIVQNLNDALRLHLDYEDPDVLNKSFVYDLGLDSLDMAQLMTFCTDGLNIKISDEEFEAVHTIGELVDLLCSKAKKDW